MRLGADICKMSYKCKSSNTQRLCITPRNMRDSYIQDGSMFNIKCIHWIFSELPLTTHQDVLPQRQTHMDLVVAKVERAMNISWAPKKEGEKNSHKNCLQHSYSKILNDKKQTVIKTEGNNHKRKPIVRHPKTFAASKRSPNYKKGKMMFYWYSKAEGQHWVSTVTIWLCI